MSITVFDSAPDVGGCGVARADTRAPPPRTTKEPTCSRIPDAVELSGMPRGEQVQRYPDDYARTFDLHRRVRPGCRVLAAELDEQVGRRRLRLHTTATGIESDAEFDQLIVADGIFCDPFLPPIRDSTSSLGSEAGSARPRTSTNLPMRPVSELSGPRADPLLITVTVRSTVRIVGAAGSRVRRGRCRGVARSAGRRRREAVRQP